MSAQGKTLGKITMKKNSFKKFVKGLRKKSPKRFKLKIKDVIKKKTGK